jgi:uncharacterized protein YicC (UPF0701 family)
MTKLKHPLFLLTLLSLVLTACTQPADDPKTVAEKYWQYLQAGNTSEAEKLVSINSRRAMTDHSSRIAAISQLTNGDTKASIITTITTIDTATGQGHSETFNTVLVLQQGQWRVDINQTQIPPAPSAQEEDLQQLSDELSESMRENIDSIDDAMTQGMESLNEALHEGSKEMGESLLNMMNELNSSMQESIDKMKQRRQQQIQEQPNNQQQQTQPDPNQGEGMI